MWFAVAASSNNHDVKVFLIGEAVEGEGLTREKYNIEEQLKILVEKGGEILACVTFLKSRKLEGSDLCPVSAMMDCVKMVEWACRVVSF